MEGKFVLIRTYSAGIHVGTLVSKDGQTVLLKDARRVWRWRGANSLHEVALHGAAEDYTRISEPVPEILLTEAVEVIPCVATAQENLTRSRWGT
jgi:hypothetical protein